MITSDMYKRYLQSSGDNLSQIHQNESDEIQNITFKSDINYKRAYILTASNGWEYIDIKYWKHSNPSLSKDAVDNYIQFRPHINFAIGTYIIIPDDTSYDLGLSEDELKNPFLQPVDERTKWWLIVGRDFGNAFVRYMVQQCNWDFKWIYNGKICHSYGLNKMANSYTSGVYNSEYTSRLDDLSQAWIPDVFQLYGTNYSDVLDDNRTIIYGNRFLIGYNELNPKVYQVTKVKDYTPKGIIKLSLKQDEFDEHRDNPKLGICDYYNDMGEIQVVETEPTSIDTLKKSKIVWQTLDSKNELIDVPDNFDTRLFVGKESYFKVVFYEGDKEVSVENAEWRIELVENQYSELELKHNAEYYEGLLKMTTFEDNTIVIRPSKANSIKGMYFNLIVSDRDGDYSSSYMVEVANE